MALLERQVLGVWPVAHCGFPLTMAGCSLACAAAGGAVVVVLAPRWREGDPRHAGELPRVRHDDDAYVRLRGR